MSGARGPLPRRRKNQPEALARECDCPAYRRIGLRMLRYSLAGASGWFLKLPHAARGDLAAALMKPGDRLERIPDSGNNTV